MTRTKNELIDIVYDTISDHYEKLKRYTDLNDILQILIDNDTFTEDECLLVEDEKELHEYLQESIEERIRDKEFHQNYLADYFKD